MIDPYLEDLEARIDPAAEDALLAEWRAFCDGQFHGDVFSPHRPAPAPPRITWPTVSMSAALVDEEQMALQQLRRCSSILSLGSGDLLGVRPNYGTGTLASLFGVELFVMDRLADTLPTTRPLPGGRTDVLRLLSAGMPDVFSGLGRQTFATGRYLRERLAAYPKLARAVRVYHPDIQGPMDLCELLWGAPLFTEMVEFFVEPYNQQLLAEFGGGAVHFCGRGDHYVHRLPKLGGVHAVNLTQPEHNNMERIFEHTVDQGICLLGLPRAVADDALARGRSLHGRVHCA